MAVHARAGAHWQPEERVESAILGNRDPTDPRFFNDRGGKNHYVPFPPQRRLNYGRRSGGERGPGATMGGWAMPVPEGALPPPNPGGMAGAGKG